MALVDFQVEIFPLRFHHVCQEEDVIFHDISFEGGERNICRDCVD